MPAHTTRTHRRLTVGIAALALLPAGAALAGTDLVKHASLTKPVSAGATRAIAVEYPDALKYGNARYSGKAVVVGRAPNGQGSTPNLSLVTVVSAESIVGGSAYQARIHNANAPGTAPVSVKVVATTVEPLPHH